METGVPQNDDPMKVQISVNAGVQINCESVDHFEFEDFGYTIPPPKV